MGFYHLHLRSMQSESVERTTWNLYFNKCPRWFCGLISIGLSFDYDLSSKTRNDFYSGGVSSILHCALDFPPQSDRCVGISSSILMVIHLLVSSVVLSSLESPSKSILIKDVKWKWGAIVGSAAKCFSY